jgi:hypothetical protein
MLIPSPHSLIVCGSPYLLSVDYVNLSTKMGFIFGSITTLGTILIYLYLPETKDRTLEEIDEMFLNVSSTSLHVPLITFVPSKNGGFKLLTRGIACPGSKIQVVRMHRPSWRPLD